MCFLNIDRCFLYVWIERFITDRCKRKYVLDNVLYRRVPYLFAFSRTPMTRMGVGMLRGGGDSLQYLKIEKLPNAISWFLIDMKLTSEFLRFSLCTFYDFSILVFIL